MSGAIGPSPGLPREAAVPFSILGLCWVPVLAAGLVWTAGHTASWLTGNTWTGPAFGVDFVISLAGSGIRPLWPDVAAWLIWTLAATLTVLLATPALWLLHLRARSGRRARDPLTSLTASTDIEHLTGLRATERAQRLRPSLAALPRKTIDPSQTGIALGRLSTGRRNSLVVRASWEDVVLAVMAPRAGKTTALAIPAILAAPGPVVATSNKSDLWAATHDHRHQQTGERVWVFDPQAITGTARSWWWNPLAACTTVEEAHRLAGHFLSEIRGDRTGKDFWASAASDLLTALLLAAGLSGRDLVEVYEWLNDPVQPTPVDILRRHGQTGAAAALEGRVHGAPETRDGIYETARTAAQCLRDPAILAWITPPTGVTVERFDPTAFVGTRQTLYLLSKDGAGAAAPLVAALTDQVMRAGTRQAESSGAGAAIGHGGGRLDPPLVIVLDEAANICRIADLPDLYSHLGSRGITPITILQSYKQGVRVWGEAGMDALWSASTIKLIGAGIDDPRLAEDISRMIGDHDITIRSVNHGRHGSGENLNLRRQRILAPEAVRALPRGTALLFATGCRPVTLTLQPCYDPGGSSTDVRRTA